MRHVVSAVAELLVLLIMPKIVSVHVIDSRTGLSFKTMDGY